MTTPSVISIDVDDDLGRRLLAFARGAWSAEPADLGDEGSLVAHVSVSIGSGTSPALVARSSGELAGSLTEAVQALRRRAYSRRIVDGPLRVGLVTDVSAERTAEVRGQVLIDPSLEGLYLGWADVILTPEELMAWRLVGDDKRLRTRRLVRYIAQRDGIAIAARAGWDYRVLRFASFVEHDGRPVRLVRGNLPDPETAPDALLASAVAGGEYLLRHQFENGEFGYIYRPWDDSYADDYNLLRHAGTSYALLELSGATDDERFLEAGEAGIEALLRYARPPLEADRQAGFEAIVGEDGAGKVGGAGLAILALVQHEIVTGSDRFRDRAHNLAAFLLHQLEPDGHFVSRYFYGPEGDNSDSVYYPGEAILALTRLAAAAGEQRYLDAAVVAARWLIHVRDAGKPNERLPHDHWLLMGLNDLARGVDDEDLRAHALRIAEAIVAKHSDDPPHRDWRGGFYVPPRSTPTATRSEALVAAADLAGRTGADRETYLRVLASSTGFQRRCQYDPVNTVFLPRPDRALGGFRGSLVNHEVRIDYVQHSVSSILGYRSLLLGDR